MRLKVGNGGWQSRLTLDTRATSASRHLCRRRSSIGWRQRCVGGTIFFAKNSLKWHTDTPPALGTRHSVLGWARVHNDASLSLWFLVLCPFSQQQQFSMLCAELLTKFASRQTTAGWYCSLRPDAVRLSFKAANALSWLHKNEITQEIK